MNKKIIETSLLQVLVTFMEEGNVSAAARKLGLSQPAASHALKRLRLFFNDPLLVRVGLRMMPTPLGKEMAIDAAKLLMELEQLGQSKKPFSPDEYEGIFVISAPEYIEHLLGPVLNHDLGKVCPNAKLLVRPPDPEHVDKNLEAGVIDLRLGFVDSPSENMRARSLYAEKFVCLVNKKHPATQGSLTLERYATMRHVRSQVSRPSTASRMIDQAVASMGGQVDVAMVVTSYLTLGRVVATSDLVATVPIGIATTLVSTLPLQMVAPPVQIPPLKAAMYWHERFHNDSRHKWFRKFVLGVSTKVFAKLT